MINNQDNIPNVYFDEFSLLSDCKPNASQSSERKESLEMVLLSPFTRVVDRLLKPFSNRFHKFFSLSKNRNQFQVRQEMLCYET